jgi:hypothetical protein
MPPDTSAWHPQGVHGYSHVMKGGKKMNRKLVVIRSLLFWDGAGKPWFDLVFGKLF